MSYSIPNWEQISSSHNWYSNFADVNVIDWGIELNKKTGKYMARTYSGEGIWRKYMYTSFDTLEEATKARKDWELSYTIY
jgi:hypothetical protein